MTIRVELCAVDLDAIRRHLIRHDPKHGLPLACPRCVIAVLLAEVERLRAERDGRAGE